MELQRKIELERQLVAMLVEESRAHGTQVPSRFSALLQREPSGGAAEDEAYAQELWLAFRSLVNVRPPWPAPEGFLSLQDELLQGLIAEAGVWTLADAALSPLFPQLYLWRGDITTLAVDAIVNAANSGMTGCWAPLHYCIDNAIHTFSGIQLRAECARFMEKQGHPEPTAQAKVTPAYNLPSRWVVHTVGPIVDGHTSPRQREELAQCYRVCLDAAAAAGAASIAFPCISTGVFGFPQVEAAPIAVDAVRRWLGEHAGSPMAVVFNVFGAVDQALYAKLLGLS